MKKTIELGQFLHSSLANIIFFFFLNSRKTINHERKKKESKEIQKRHKNKLSLISHIKWTQQRENNRRKKKKERGFIGNRELYLLRSFSHHIFGFRFEFRSVPNKIFKPSNKISNDFNSFHEKKKTIRKPKEDKLSQKFEEWKKNKI